MRLAIASTVMTIFTASVVAAAEPDWTAGHPGYRLQSHSGWTCRGRAWLSDITRLAQSNSPEDQEEFKRATTSGGCLPLMGSNLNYYLVEISGDFALVCTRLQDNLGTGLYCSYAEIGDVITPKGRRLISAMVAGSIE